MEKGKQVSQYDKILKENIEAVIPSLMRNVLGISAVSSEEIPDDIKHTKERKPDVLKKITDSQGRTFILQIEFQVADEPKMVYRMAEYYIMLARKYALPVKQFVIFLGPSKPDMPTQFDTGRLKFDFPLITFAELDYHLFIQSAHPEEVVLGVLADFNGESPETVLRQIIQRIEETTDGDLSLKRYFSQLRVLAQLRNLDTTLKITMDSIAQFISEERDVLYLRGQEKEQIKFVTNLLTDSDFPVEKIAKVADVSVNFVKSIQRKLSADK